ncbi:wall-associated receptor kinase-like 8 [Hibiscus syriacus]|uniref:wall-associated receptor kinase-like 8 n=1 Tax=Hibiscus syriacus TaxID=106335 RepID=UPI0019247260|nr:wall-associated receptor kinase-like 8 [Hibiscus syriacus]
MLKSAESQEANCGEEVCGNVTIPFPFGIHRSCYRRSWFIISCKRTHNGEKPFICINGVDLEVLGSLFSPDTILIKKPVTFVNCDHKKEATVSVNLTGTPFFFSTDYNMFGSVGCGNLATIFGNDGEPLGGCIQPRCDDGASETEPGSGCINQVFGNFSSTVVNMTAMYPGAKGCASAFLFTRFYFRADDPLAIGSGINIDTTHVPTTLIWDSTIALMEQRIKMKKRKKDGELLNGGTSVDRQTMVIGDVDMVMRNGRRWDWYNYGATLKGDDTDVFSWIDFRTSLETVPITFGLKVHVMDS